MKTGLIRWGALLVLFTIAASASAQAHLVLARDFLAGLKTENNVYRHGGMLRWRGDEGMLGTVEENEARIDCSGFVNEILKKAGSETYEQVYRRTSWRSYPKAESYYEAIVAGYGFRRREFSELQPGDVVAIKYEPGARDTGHVMFVDVAPERIEARSPFVSGTQQWKLVVIDASSVPAEDDTRTADGKRSTGVGRGTVRIYTDEAGQMLGYVRGPKGVFRAVGQRPIALGVPL